VKLAYIVFGMDKKAELDKLHSRVFALRKTMGQVCNEAGVAHSTVSRWNNNPDSMTAGTLRRMEIALERMEAGQ